MGKGIGCKICEMQEEKMIEKVLKEYEKKIERMTVAEMYEDLEKCAERKKRKAEQYGAQEREGQNESDKHFEFERRSGKNIHGGKHGIRTL